MCPTPAGTPTSRCCIRADFHCSAVDSEAIERLQLGKEATTPIGYRMQQQLFGTSRSTIAIGCKVLIAPLAQGQGIG
eukprot:3122929-Amphidinium_carterae.1